MNKLRAIIAEPIYWLALFFLELGVLTLLTASITKFGLSKTEKKATKLSKEIDKIVTRTESGKHE